MNQTERIEGRAASDSGTNHLGTGRRRKGYEHFGVPMLLNTAKVMQRIRNIKYKFFPDNELLATTVNKYETRSILEALHNCIAHQDYSLHSRIIVTEKVDRLIKT